MMRIGCFELRGAFCCVCFSEFYVAGVGWTARVTGGAKVALLLIREPVIVGVLAGAYVHESDGRSTATSGVAVGHFFFGLFMKQSLRRDHRGRTRRGCRHGI